MRESDFKLILRPHARALRQLRLNLDFFLEDVGNIIVYSITDRLKTFDSASRKSTRLKIDIENLDDLAGLRCVVATSEEVEVLGRFLDRMAYLKDLKIDKKTDIARKDGYRARHYVITLPGRYHRSTFEGRVEIQLLTIFQHSFNFISRAWVYKESTTLGNDWYQRFHVLSKELEKLEAETNELHKIIIESSTSNNDMEPLTPMSIKFISKSFFGDNVSMDEAVDSCRFLVDLGCDTNGKFRAFLSREDIGKFREHLQSLVKTDPDLLRLLKFFLEMPILTFWMFFGPRMHASYELISSLVQSDRSRQANKSE